MEEDFLDGKEPLDDKFAVFIKGKLIGIYKKVNENSVIAKAEFVYN